jgi:membrane protein
MTTDQATRRAPESPTDLPRRSWRGVMSRTVVEFKDDSLTVWAAALTYYGILSIFPAIIALVSILGLIGPSATQPILDNIGQLAPGAARDILTSAIENVQRSRGSAGVAFVLGIVVAVWSASGYVGAFMQASNAIYDIEEGRPIWKTIPIRVGTTLVLLVLLAVSAVAVVLTGSLARHAGDVVGVGGTAVTAWDIAKWPVLLLLVAGMFAILYYASPNVKHAGIRWVSPGGLVAVLLWIVVSLAFAFYVGTFGSYNKTYGALAAPVIFLIWLWLSNLAVLLGAEFDAELERGRRIEAGHPPDLEPYAEPRDTRAFSS